MSTNFKTCVFGGFDREDVINYIEKSAKESQERIEALESENTKLKEYNERIELALRTLHTQAKQYKQDGVDQEILQQQLAYAHLKEHIADIEINAHRRTEEFRTEAFAKLHQCIDAQRAWCQTQRSRYANMNETLLQDMRRAEDILANNDLSGFDEILETLQDLEDTLR